MGKKGMRRLAKEQAPPEAATREKPQEKHQTRVTTALAREEEKALERAEDAEELELERAWQSRARMAGFTPTRASATDVELENVGDRMLSESYPEMVANAKFIAKYAHDIRVRADMTKFLMGAKGRGVRTPESHQNVRPMVVVIAPEKLPPWARGKTIDGELARREVQVPQAKDVDDEESP